jgi:hypothetical protein
VRAYFAHHADVPFMRVCFACVFPQLLSALHSENRLNKRFPIGLVEQIKSWSNEEVKAYHRAHYRPNNAHLYVIGDVDTDEAEEMVARVFGHLENRPPQEYPPEEEMVYPNLKQENRFLPPVVHEWLGLKQHGRDTARVDIFQVRLPYQFWSRRCAIMRNILSLDQAQCRNEFFRERVPFCLILTPTCVSSYLYRSTNSCSHSPSTSSRSSLLSRF